jgi:ribosomal-protein-alanine N-acetyltransferase
MAGLDLMQTLQTKRLLIRRFSMDDLETAHQILDLEMQWDGADVSLQQRRQALQRYITLAEWNDGSRLFGSRGIFLKVAEQLVGLCGFHPWLWTPSQKALFWPELFRVPETAGEYAHASFELSILYGLSNRHRGQGYATEAANALIEYAFGTLQVKRIFADTTRSNIGSINVMKRVGMRIAHHPTRPDEEWPDGPAVVGCIENIRQV